MYLAQVRNSFFRSAALVLDDFRTRHKIPEEFHVAVLAKIGWTQAELDAGRRKASGRLHFLPFTALILPFMAGTTQGEWSASVASPGFA